MGNLDFISVGVVPWIFGTAAGPVQGLAAVGASGKLMIVVEGCLAVWTRPEALDVGGHRKMEIVLGDGLKSYCIRDKNGWGATFAAKIAGLCTVTEVGTGFCLSIYNERGWCRAQRGCNVT